MLKIIKEHQTNEDIRDKEIRVIDSDGSQLGIMPTSNALSMAMDKSLDLVKISPKAIPPVCKIMNYAKYCFEQSKKEKEAKKNQRIVDIKEIRLSLNIDVHDFNTKVNHVKRFIDGGNKVKVSIRFKGREMGHSEIGYDVMNRFSEACSEFAIVEKSAKLDGHNMLMFLAAKPVQEKKSSKPKKQQDNNVVAETEKPVQEEKSNELKQQQDNNVFSETQKPVQGEKSDKPKQQQENNAVAENQDNKVK